ncbi:MAG TPA: DUF547 domain-containing protein [Burkholderiales bacterium]|nr:DUF547 domain-containing protein [Burkholderiales bacterium]
MTGNLDKELAEALEAARQAHFDPSGAVCDYTALARSGERERLAACLFELAGFDIKRAQIPSQLAFWVNVFNAGVLRDARELETARGVREVEGFFERSRLRIGEHSYSLDDIEHGLLRGNVAKPGRSRPPMERGDPRLEYMPIVFEERMHFALHSACRSSPPLRAFDGGKLDRQLEAASADYIRRNVRVERQGAVLFLPRIFRWFAEDFGGDSGILDFVVSRIEDEKVVDMIDRRLGAVTLRYAEFDWTLNRR